jgi:RNA polymerase sigma-70 factor, ECF subfamily
MEAGFFPGRTDDPATPHRISAVLASQSIVWQGFSPRIRLGPAAAGVEKEAPKFQEGWMSETPRPDLLQGLRDRRSSAFRVLNARYIPRLIAWAQALMGQKLRKRLDAEDVVQSALLSWLKYDFFVPSREEELWGLLRYRTECKVFGKARYHGRIKRCASREAPSPDGPEPIDFRHGSPEARVLLDEAIRDIKGGLTDLQMKIIDRMLEGYSGSEIAADLKCSTRSVTRAREAAATALRARLESGESPVASPPL